MVLDRVMKNMVSAAPQGTGMPNRWACSGARCDRCNKILMAAAVLGKAVGLGK
jgi:hypothetical protein